MSGREIQGSIHPGTGREAGEQGGRGAEEDKGLKVETPSSPLYPLFSILYPPSSILHPPFLVLLLILAFAVFFSALSIQQHRAFLTNGLDLGNVDQALWNTAQGRFLHFTLMAPLQSRLALHVEPVLLFFVPFYWLDLGGPELLLITQAAVVALGAWPIYQLTLSNYTSSTRSAGQFIKDALRTTHHTPRSMPYLPRLQPFVVLIFPLAYLLLPTLQAAVLFDFHAVTLASTFLLFAFWALDQKKDHHFIGFALLVMACKEDMPLVVMMLGLYAGLGQRRWRLAGVTIGLSLAWFMIAFFVIQPRFAAGGNIQLDRYAWLGDHPLAMIQTIITRPDRLFNHLWSQVDPANYLTMLLFPTAFLALLSPLTLLPMLPPLAINLLSENPFPWRLEDFHYGAALAPFLLISTIYGIRHLTHLATHHPPKTAPQLPIPPSSNPMMNDEFGPMNNSSFTIHHSLFIVHPASSILPPLLALLLLTFSLIYHYQRGFTPLARSFQWPPVTAHHRRLEALLAAIPAGEPVFTQSNLAPHLSHRPTLYADFAYFTDPAFRARTETVAHVILDITSLENRGGLHQFLRQALLESGEYHLVEAQDGIIHLRPIPSSLQGTSAVAALPPTFYTFTQPETSLDYALPVDFGRVMRLHGYSLHFNRQEEIQVTVDLELLQPANSTQPALYLLDAQGRPLGATVELQPTLVWFPVESWPVGERVRLRFNTLPWYTRQMPAYRLALGVTAGDVWEMGQRQWPEISRPTGFAPRFPADGTLLELAFIEQPWAMPAGGPSLRQFNRPVLPDPIQANFGNQLLLLGYTHLQSPIPNPQSHRNASQSPISNLLQPSNLPPVPGTGATFQPSNLSLTLYWQAVTTPEPLTRFVQLVGPDGRIYGQQDSAPDGGLYPTNQWRPGEVVVETVIAPVQGERPAGPYTVHIGLYRPATGERLPLLSGGDHVEINLLEDWKVAPVPGTGGRLEGW